MIRRRSLGRSTSIPQKILSFGWILLLFLIQQWASRLWPQGEWPLVLVAVVFYALSRGPVFGMTLGLWAGFLMDLFGIGRIGPGILLYSTVGGIVGLGHENFFLESLWTQILLPVFAQCSLRFFYLIALNASSEPNAADLSFISLLRESAYSSSIFWAAFWGPVLCRLLRRFGEAK